MALTISPSPFGSLTVTVAETQGSITVNTLATSPSILSMALGVPGPKGDAGSAGADGQPGQDGQDGIGVPTGGSTGQALVKASGDNYDTTWGDFVKINDPISITAFDGSENSQGLFLDAGFIQIGEGSDIEQLYALRSQFSIGDNPKTYIKGDFYINDISFNTILDSKLSLAGGTMQNNANVTFLSTQGPAISINSTSGDNILGIELTAQGEDIDNRLEINTDSIVLINNRTGTNLEINSSTIKFPDNTNQLTAFLPNNYLTASSIASTYLSQSSAASTYFPIPTGTTSEYIDGTGSLQTFPSVTSVGKMVTAVYNNTGATIPKGSVVYINGKHGSEPTIALAKADAESTSAYTIGLTDASIANNASGNIITSGTIENLATNAYSDGTPLYLSATTAGGLTATKQFAPNHYVKIGTVINAHPTAGTIFIKVENGYQLDELSDCAVTAPANNNILTYESSTSLWKDKSVSTALGYAPANQTLGNLSSSSTARTNLGLGSMALETASNYLTTATAASVYTTKANNLSDLSNTATARTNLGLGTASTNASTVFAQVSNNLSDVTAGTARTNLGLAYATDAQVIAGTSASVVVSPLSALALNLHPESYVLNAGNFTSVSSGNGIALAQEFGFQLSTGTTANSYAIRKVSPTTQVGVSRGQAAGIYDFSKQVMLSGNCVYNLVQANTNVRATLGKVTGDNNGDLTRLGFGLKQSGTNPMQVHVHNGTSASTSTNSTFTPTATQGFDWRVISDGTGNAYLYVNDAQVASTTGAPTGLTSNTANFIQYEIDCSANLTSQSIASIGNPKLFQGR